MNDYINNMKNGQTNKTSSPKTRKTFDNSYPHTASSRFNSYGQNYPNTRGGNVKRPAGQGIQQGNQPSSDENSASSMLFVALDTLNNLIDKILKTQDDMINIQEKNSDILERQAIAMERIVEYLYAPVEEEFEESADVYETQTFESDDIITRETESDLNIMEHIEASEKSKQLSGSKDKKNKSLKQIQSFEGDNTQTENTPYMTREAVFELIYNMRDKGATYAEIAQHLADIKQPTFSGHGEWHAQTIHRFCNKN
jgi:hypothetical protein